MPEIVLFDIEALPEYRKEALCRTLTTTINRLLKDEENRADFERWKQERQLSIN